MSITPTEFMTLKKRMGGFGEASKSFSLGAIMSSSSSSGKREVAGASGSFSGSGVCSETELITIVKKMLNVFLVQGAGVNELLFAGCSRKGMMEEKAALTWLMAKKL